ncbi:MAG TPA: hypothetical protein VN495_02470 [Candidatus Paceibacterota bacterium]|nr:hypothetical protein [Candidatus Paceibacterota bacterium]
MFRFLKKAAAGFAIAFVAFGIMSAPSAEAGWKRQVMVWNFTGNTLWNLKAARITNTLFWDRNYLPGTDHMLPWEHRQFDFEDRDVIPSNRLSCLRDIRAEFVNAPPVELDNVDVCHINVLTITPRGASFR